MKSYRVLFFVTLSLLFVSLIALKSSSNDLRDKDSKIESLQDELQSAVNGYLNQNRRLYLYASIDEAIIDAYQLGYSNGWYDHKHDYGYDGVWHFDTEYKSPY